MPDSNQMFGKSSGDTPDFFFFCHLAQMDWNWCNYSDVTCGEICTGFLFFEEERRRWRIIFFRTLNLHKINKKERKRKKVYFQIEFWIWQKCGGKLTIQLWHCLTVVSPTKSLQRDWKCVQLCFRKFFIIFIHSNKYSKESCQKKLKSADYVSFAS